jgi:ubiquinone/menaquinone biosynthesis C-methylase UbiE
MMMLERWLDVWRRFSGSGAYPHELAPLLLLPLRRIVLSPEQLVAELALTPASRVLEVGPGPGFFSPTVARAVPRGRLDLLDVQREMLQKARARLRRAGLQAGYTQASADRLPYAAATFDVAYLVAVLGEVPNPAQCVAEVARVLRPSGRLVVAELPGDPDALTEPQLRTLAGGTGLALVASRRVSRATLTSFQMVGGTAVDRPMLGGGENPGAPESR